jgi:HEPN domain-containing protein
MPNKPKPPNGDAFYVTAEGYKDGGDACFYRLSDPSYCGQIIYTCVFLYFRAIELYLKAALADRGISYKQIKDAKHNIKKLLILLKQVIPPQKLGLLASDIKFLQKYADDYLVKWFEYPHKLHDLEFEKETIRDICHKFSRVTQPRS